MTKVVSLMVARESQKWLEMLYDGGALTFDANGTVTVSPAIRNHISNMHDELAAGDPQRKAELEDAFDKAISETSALGKNLGPGVLSP